MSPVKSFRIECNVKPDNFDTAEFRWLASLNLQTGQSIGYDRATGTLYARVRHRRFRALSASAVVKELSNHVLHLVGYRNKVIEPKAKFQRETGSRIGTSNHNVVGAIYCGASKIDLVIQPDLYCLHDHCLSDGGLNSPSSSGAKAGGASSFTREGGAA